jgi:anti-anti-sigma regulatory factor
MKQPTFVAESDQLRPGVLLVRVCGWLDRPAAARLRVILDGCLDSSPRAVVLDLSALSGLGPDAVPPLVEIAFRAGTTDIGLYLVATGDAIDHVLRDGETSDLFDIHRGIGSVERALGGCS